MDTGTLALLIPILGTLMGGLVVLIPVAGLTARFALKPIVEAMARFRETQGGTAPGELHLLEQRVALLEQQLQGIETSVGRLVEAREFERQLASGRP